MELAFEVVAVEKNTPNSKIENTSVGNGLYMIKVENKGQAPFRLKREIDQSLIQFYFAAEGGAEFVFSGGNYKLQLAKEKSLLFYNPNMALPLDIWVPARAKLLFIYITVESLHKLFVAESEEIAFLNSDNINKKYYADRPLSPHLALTVGQLFDNAMNGPAREVFEHAKAYEILAYFFNREEGADAADNCPFLNDEENVERIRLAKKLIIERMSNPPALAELAREIGLNEYRLKEGFKNIYGKTVFQFLNDYRLDTARHLLDNKNSKVNDAAYHIGYSNPSHFIAAFRKKFGVTPKKYLQSKN
jgi:AraC-like DNA-binding protein